MRPPHPAARRDRPNDVARRPLRSVAAGPSEPFARDRSPLAGAPRGPFGPRARGRSPAPELGLLAKVFTQDTFNLPNVQAGLMAAQYDAVTLARYQETKIRHFHHLLAQWVDTEAG